MPILKQLVSGSSQSKRRSRADLTAEMISAPLGDFRHTMHVGRGGDAFGDTSFLSTRTGEPPQNGRAQPSSPGSKPGLLSRTFRSSKRSQSVNRADKQEQAPASPEDCLVKNAVSLPYLADEGGDGRIQVPKSLSSTPLKNLPEVDNRPLNGAVASKASDLELDERRFGELTDLPPFAGFGRGGMKHAESIMSFHVDLGPSMLGDILSVMDKKGWDDDDLGYEEGKSSEGHASPSPLGLQADAEEDGEAEELLEPPLRPPRAVDVENHEPGPYTPEPWPKYHQHLDSCSISSSGSAALEEKPLGLSHGGDTDSAKFSSPRGEDEKDFSFMDEDDDEIRV
ncbi:cdc42 effector protein 4-like [Paramormyrops kingsleyae]|uniref:CDC42 effector protein 4 n=1 Tax=Paramormyrops kingsleyae TaxID=1676925 RepID=A0A3B3SMP0_9TELE|nr:cdc42 effector protein 4 [Paramormyrops kingsleyae]XP_023672719.1 cdc42 effector protein 4 [Paramormyrops kingsleyae]XP_023672721.1 cdc42 effector protein 4 [Paramormyrops kingsleyae]XP_023672722.1 cdc42 effector protein 4 [Paramormyrops kingsleyae]